MKYTDEYTFGKFLKRHNRFLAEVKVDGVPIEVHVPDPGRLLELLIPNARVLLRKEFKSTRKTRFDLIGVRTGKVWVEIDSQSTNRLVEIDFPSIPFLNEYYIKKREFQFGSSRLDFLLQRKDADDQALMEVKSVTLVEGGVALFPDAPTLRGKRHVLELIDAKEAGFVPILLFVVKRHDATSVSTNSVTDPGFSQAVSLAQAKGVMIRAISCRFTLRDLIIERELPVQL